MKTRLSLRSLCPNGGYDWELRVSALLGYPGEKGMIGSFNRNPVAPVV